MTDEKIEGEKAGIGVITRAAAILRVLGDVATGMSLGQIARQVGLPRSTVQRLVYAMEAEGLVMSGSEAARISLGPEFMRLAKLARPAVIDRLHPIMEKLSAAIEETIDLSMVQRNRIIFLDQVVGSQRLLAVSHVGDAFPLHCSSVGKAYLATLTPEEIKRAIGETYEALTPNTITTRPSLIDALRSTQETGIGSDEEEHSEAICAVGLIFEDELGDWYGLSIPMPVGRFRVKRAKAEQLLIKARHQIERAATEGFSRAAAKAR